jgi:integrase
MAHEIKMKGSAFAWVSWRAEDGRRHRKSTGIHKDDPQAARLIAAELARLRKVEAASPRDATPGAFQRWVPRWLARLENEHTRTRYTNAWNALIPFLEARQLRHPGGVRYRHAREWMDWRTGDQGRERKWNTAIVELRVLAAIMQEAVRREFIGANPLQKLGLKRRAGKVKPEITPAEERQILAECVRRAALGEQDAWMGRAFVVAMRHGCRLSETDVPLCDVDIERKTIYFARTKGGKVRVVPAHPDVVEIAKARKAAGAETLVGLPVACPGKRFLMMLRSIGLNHLCFHCTRVTVVSRLARAGVPLAQAMEFVGHGSSEVHAIYRRFSPGDFSAALAAVTTGTSGG